MRLFILMMIVLVMAHEEKNSIMKAVEKALELLQQQHRPNVEEPKGTRSKRPQRQQDRHYR
jgi:hypothetical protein